ncbi:MS ion channel protein [Taphrina deformans PYCC 5710]|uniref:MS ion channel protein n=1 Tax=Taphrina deformans (strain PYCC 5710 / ATCC 11124 / CBS 356.35 / IMI 108563 / JCM 9778 / NBRC 8474) TaxID=1097556 RepID=R4X8C4_TAPDE|nr:MS ion channel protein [Taphrina deformans PYCC 5710]|eukprot:CCG81808.1 MS ion channel protein [Taphrina deformans PYCC 5710]
MSEKRSGPEGAELLDDGHESDGDTFDQIADHPAHLPVSQVMVRPIKRPLTTLGKIFKWVHNFSMFTRWFLYITPLTLILLVPLLVGALYHPQGRVFSVAGVELQWFAIWWEIIWLTLWAAKLAAKLIPLIVGPIFSVFTNSYKKWRDLCVALEVALTLFFWWLAVYISFLPIMEHHQSAQYAGTRQGWQTTLNRIILSVFIAACLNLIEKLLIQLVAIGFHQRQYEDRIVLNKFQIASLTKLYKYSRETERLTVDNDVPTSNIPSGARTPNQALNMVGRAVQKTARDAVGKVTGEIAGRRMEHSNAPRQVVLSLLDSTTGAQTLARRLFASYHAIHNKADEDYIRREEMRDAFNEDEEADAAFAMFDKDFNGDVTCEEMEIACVEISKERKSITSSLKDLDHAVSKLDDICVVIVAIIVVLIFISLISRSFSGVLTSAGTTILGLSWLFSQLAQEFLASIVFVFVKHPFDVGDRVDVLMNGTVQSLLVKEISLMATEFRMLDGRIVQAPNNVLNQLFILNMRRTGGVAEGVPTTLRFGVSIEKIDALRQSMLEFVRSEPRDYKPDILSELTDIPNLQSVKFSLIFFHKQNWQNEGLRIGRRNKFMCALMTNMQRLGMESSIYNGPGGAPETPMFLQYMQAPVTSSKGISIPGSAAPAHPSVSQQPFDPLTSNAAQNAQISNLTKEPENEEAIDDDEPTVIPGHSHEIGGRRASVLNSGVRRRPRKSSVAAHMQTVDYSLGATDFAQSNANDFFEESQERGLQAVLEVAEEYEDRAQEERYARERKERKSASRARSPSSGSMLQRSSTNMSARSRTGSRRNRFRLMPSRTRASRDERRSGEYDEEYNLEQIPSGESGDTQRSTAARTIDSVISGQRQRRNPSPAAVAARDMSVIPEDREASISPLRRGLTEMSFGADEVLNVTPAAGTTSGLPTIRHTSPSPAP